MLFVLLSYYPAKLGKLKYWAPGGMSPPLPAAVAAAAAATGMKCPEPAELTAAVLSILD